VKTWIQISLVICFMSFQAQANPKIHSFKEWKGEKIQTAIVQTMQVRAQLLKAKANSNLLQKTSLEKQLEQTMWHLDMAKELSVTDYFVMYLSPLTAPDRFQIAAQKLSTAEIAELMKAYAAELNSSNPQQSNPQPAVTGRATAGPKLPIQATQN